MLLYTEYLYLQHSADIYFKSIKILADSDCKELQRSDTGISDEFVCPIIEHMKITQYENEAIIVVKGKKLWFVHSIKLSASSTFTEPFQIQPTSISFKVNADTIGVPDSQEESQIVVFSHFHPPVEAQICVHVDVSLKKTINNFHYACNLYHFACHFDR